MGTASTQKQHHGGPSKGWLGNNGGPRKTQQREVCSWLGAAPPIRKHFKRKSFGEPSCKLLATWRPRRNKKNQVGGALGPYACDHKTFFW